MILLKNAELGANPLQGNVSEFISAHRVSGSSHPHRDGILSSLGWQRAEGKENEKEKKWFLLTCYALLAPSEKADIVMYAGVIVQVIVSRTID